MREGEKTDPTPWTVERDDSGGEPGLWSVRDANGGLVFFGMSEDVARLFGAAPDLLATLKGLVGLVQLVRSRGDCPVEIKQALTDQYRLDEAFAAIQRAES